MNKIIFEKVGQRLKQAREENHITLEEAGKKADVHKSTVLRWENGETEKIKLPIIEIFADFYSVNPLWLMGYDVPKTYHKFDMLGNPVITIPILGIVKAGYNYLAEENWIGTVDIDKKLITDESDFFALKVKGDSMSPYLLENDIVIIKKQNNFEDGDIIVALVNGNESTIKKAKKINNGILLQPLNLKYEPLIFTYDQMKEIPVIIIGTVIQSRRNF